MERIDICKGKPGRQLCELLKKAGFDLKTLHKAPWFCLNSSIEVPAHFRIKKQNPGEIIIEGYYQGRLFKLRHCKQNHYYIINDETFEHEEIPLQTRSELESETIINQTTAPAA